MGYARRNFLVPVPEINDLDELNDMLLARCTDNRRKRRDRRKETVQELLQDDRANMLQLPSERIDCCIRRTVSIDHCSRFRFDTNAYSVPYSYAGRSLTPKAYVDRLEVFCVDRLVARHSRSYARQQDRLELNHYLEVLARKPGALRDAKPWRHANVPPAYRQLFDTLKSTSQGCRDFIDVLILRRDGDAEVVDQAVETAIARGMPRLDVIEQLVARALDIRPASTPASVGDRLQSISVPTADLSRYDTLKKVTGGVWA